MITTVQIELRQARAEDLKSGDNQLKVGQPFWYKSLNSSEFSNKAYTVNYDLDLQELKWQLEHGMIWIPISDIWLNDYRNELILKEKA